MGATTTLITVEEFLKLPEVEGERLELINGEVISMPLSGQPHEVTKSNVIRVVTACLLQNPTLKLFCEAAYQLDARNCLIPDISLIASSRIVPGSMGVFRRAPEVAIEVVSSEPAARLERKIKLYLAHGSKSVWALYPQERLVRIEDASGGLRKFLDGQPLVDPNLPGFTIPTSAIFEGV
jgi:Uma2 family endonuclease